MAGADPPVSHVKQSLAVEIADHVDARLHSLAVQYAREHNLPLPAIQAVVADAAGRYCARILGGRMTGRDGEESDG